MKGYSSISSCSFGDHSAACLYASFLEKDAICLFIPLKRGWFSLLSRKLHCTNRAPPPENRKLGLTVQEIKNWFEPQPTEKKRNTFDFLVQRGPSQESNFLVDQGFLHADMWKQTQRSPEEEIDPRERSENQKNCKIQKKTKKQKNTKTKTRKPRKPRKPTGPESL